MECKVSLCVSVTLRWTCFVLVFEAGVGVMMSFGYSLSRSFLFDRLHGACCPIIWPFELTGSWQYCEGDFWVMRRIQKDQSFVGFLGIVSSF